MDFKKEVIRLAVLMEQKGFLNQREGNISILDRETNKMYITPSGKRKLTLTEDMIAVLDLESEEQLEGNCKASSEYRLHKAAYLCRPDVNGVVHCHSPFMTAYAVQAKPIKIHSNNAFRLAHGEIPCLPYGMAGTDDIHKGLAEALSDRNACLLANHGVIVVDKTLDLAVARHETLEGAVKVDTIARLIGMPKDIPDAEELYANKSA